MKTEELKEAFKPFVYPYAGSGFMTGTEDEDIIERNAQICMDIAIQYAEQFKPKWVSAKVGDQIETGWYWVRFLHHDTGIEGEEVVFMTDEIPYHYATAISRVEPPKTV